jgi:hypothetical protein
MKRVRRAKADLHAERVRAAVDLLDRAAAVAGALVAAVEEMVAGAAMADAAAKAGAGEIVFRTKIIGSPRDSLANRAGREFRPSRFHRYAVRQTAAVHAEME